jgi:hypothetical protein
MAYYDNQKCVSFEAGQDLSSNQFYFVSVSADGQVDPTGDGAYAVGVLQNEPAAAGRAAEVAIGGKTQVSCGGSVTAGGPVASDGNGQAVDAASGDVILGEAMEAGSSDEVITILFHPRGAQ